MMQNEIFGTILPILTFVSMNEVIQNHVNKREKPLAVYYFGNSQSENFTRLENETSSGALVANDVMAQVLHIETGFGGVGMSG